MNPTPQHLPHTGPARESLREKGQFWTPGWIADAMVAYALIGEADTIFDPAVGAGAFFRSAKSLVAETGRRIKLSGAEIDPRVLQQARVNGLAADDLHHVELTDFVLDPPRERLKAIVANPPYIRHHRLSGAVKAQLRALAMQLIGRPLDGRAGLHVYFLLRALQFLSPTGRLAFIVPADTCEGVFAPLLWGWIARKYRLDAVVTFAPEASPFPGVDTNPVIILIRNLPPSDSFHWANCLTPGTGDLQEWIRSGFKTAPGKDITVCRRDLQEGLSTGLSRAPVVEPHQGPVLADFAGVQRGIATGANDFFFLTRQQAAALHLPEEFLVSAIGRTRDVPGDTVTDTLLRQLDEQERPTLLFCPDGRPLHDFPPPVRAYLQTGAEQGLNKKTLLATRNPWYKMEFRTPPPLLFSYLGRRNTRFIRNLAGVVPLTCLLCVYPHRTDQPSVDALWQVLRHPDTIANLALVGKSYGGGAIKVEPRALERLPIPNSVLAEMESAGIAQPATDRRQLELGFEPEAMLTS